MQYKLPPSTRDSQKGLIKYRLVGGISGGNGHKRGDKSCGSGEGGFISWEEQDERPTQTSAQHRVFIFNADQKQKRESFARAGKQNGKVPALGGTRSLIEGKSLEGEGGKRVDEFSNSEPAWKTSQESGFDQRHV